jgi:hypothetical protein
MKCNFIELTGNDDSKILINIFHIGWVEPHKTGSIITFNMANNSMPKKVKESYENIKSLMSS